MSATERIVGLRVSARNNYTCTSEQDITAWRSRGNGPISQVLVAIGLDTAEAEAVERRGCSGTGSGAHLLALIATDEKLSELTDDDEEEITSLNHPLVRELPVGDVRQLRQHISEQRRSQVWDGHNHVSIPPDHGNMLLAQIRQQ